MLFVCDSRDGIAREVCFMGYYEPQETVLMLSLLRPGMSFVDVGANWGYFTLLGSDLVGRSGRVIAFEPHPTLYAQLRGNVLRNNLTWTTALPIAITNTEGEMTLAGFEEEETTNWGVSHLIDAPDYEGPQFQVLTGLLEVLLDNQGVREIDMLKIDIEGAEALVLPTMSKGLSQARYKRILLELHPIALKERGVAPKSLIETLISHGYRGWSVDHSQAAFRRAAYQLPVSPTEFLAPIDLDSSLDAWPHMLFLAPGILPTW
jgi:FkbM family methyltransferase